MQHHRGGYPYLGIYCVARHKSLAIYLDAPTIVVFYFLHFFPFHEIVYGFGLFFIMATDQNRTIDEAKLHMTSVFQTTAGDHAIIDHVADSDEEILVALGYRQEFKRDFSIWSSFSVSFACLGLLPSIASTLSFNLGYIGLSGSVWGWLVAALFIQCVALAMAELCSSMPTAGGLYYASAVLAPEGSRSSLRATER